MWKQLQARLKSEKAVQGVVVLGLLGMLCILASSCFSKPKETDTQQTNHSSEDSVLAASAYCTELEEQLEQTLSTIQGAIRALREEKDVFFLFAGHGNKMEKLRGIIAQESIENVRIHSFLHGQDFQDALAVSDCALISLEKGATGLCVPSKTYSYMMQGIPLLAIMDECDIVRDIQSGAGLWVRNGESERLAKAIRFLRDNPEKARDMRRKCRELYLQKYTTEICTGKYVSLFRELLHPETGEENEL